MGRCGTKKGYARVRFRVCSWGVVADRVVMVVA